MRLRILIMLAVLVAGLLAWYWFRPELLFIDVYANERSPAEGQEQGTVLATGRFHSVAHDSQGTATLYQLADRKRVLHFTGFETSNGPALYVYLIAAEDANDSDTVKRAGFVDLGELKGNIGAQSYEVPADVDLARYRAVTIWCRRFSVNFATAPLAPPPSEPDA